MAESAPEPLVFNGLDGATGGYMHPPTTPEGLAEFVWGLEVQDPAHEAELVMRSRRDEPTFGVAYPASADKLDEAGWGIVTAARAPAGALEALAPLCALRGDQAGARYRVFTGADGVQPGESKDGWLGRHGMGPGEAEPEKVPYYLLLVGDPDEIPFSFQYELDVHYAVGRLTFDSAEEYAQYANAVVAAEAVADPERTTIALFGPRNPGDRATDLSATHLVEPLGPEIEKKSRVGTVTSTIGDAADKAALRALLGGGPPPDVLFTAGHGVGFRADDERQREAQGALVCQDWPGPVAWKDKALPADFFFAGVDVPAADSETPSIVFAFACYGAGTPVFDDFGHLRRRNARKLAARPFVARLPQRLLSRPAGGTLAFVGHVERAWECSFVSADAGPQRGVFASTLASILDGRRVGHALEGFNSRYAGMASTLQSHLDTYAKFRLKIKPAVLAPLWIATNDARNYTLLGDPAVRLRSPA